MNNKKYNLRLTQEEMDNIVYALVLLKVDAMNCLESGIGDQLGSSKQLAMAYSLLAQCAEEEVRCTSPSMIPGEDAYREAKLNLSSLYGKCVKE
jgi:hypothetical protein